MDKILSIDPSGTGTTGIFFVSGTIEEFRECKEKNWKIHYLAIKELVKEYQLDILLFEDTNYIHKKTKDGLSLFRLLGALECLEIKKISGINVLKVKEITKQLLKGKIKISEIEYKKGRGKGWMFKHKRISIHQLEAYLVYWLWERGKFEKFS